MPGDKQQLEELKRTLKEGDMQVFKQYYLEYKAEFSKFARRYTTDQEMIADAYHDLFIVFYENLVNEKLTTLTSSLKTYLFSIGKYALLNKLRQIGRIVRADEIDPYLEVPAGIPAIHAEPPDFLKRAIGRLSASCREVIIMFYYKQYSIETIMHRLNYKNENTVKAHKSRCMKALREYARQHL